MIPYIKPKVHYDERIIPDHVLVIEMQGVQVPIFCIVDLFRVNETVEAAPYFFFVSAWSSYGDSDCDWVQINAKRSYAPVNLGVSALIVHYYPPAWQRGTEASMNLMIDISDLQNQEVAISMNVQNKRTASLSNVFLIISPIDITGKAEADVVDGQMFVWPSIAWDNVYSAYRRLESVGIPKVSVWQFGCAASQHKSLAVIPDNESYVSEETTKNLVAIDKYLVTHYVFGLVVDATFAESLSSDESAAIDLGITDLNLVAEASRLPPSPFHWFPFDFYLISFSIMTLFDETALETINVKLPKWAQESSLTARSVYEGRVQETYAMSYANGELLYHPGTSPVIRYCHILEVTGILERSSLARSIIIACPVIISILAIYSLKRARGRVDLKELGATLLVSLVGFREVILRLEQPYYWTVISLFEGVLSLVWLSSILTMWIWGAR